MNPLVKQIHSVLPQTQCTKCGYDGCLPYATAIAEGELINRCPPGGDKGIATLAALLKRPLLPLNTEECGEHTPLQVAVIEERHCIGCTLCIQACPVDAIVGANKYMHTIIADLCTGCELCVAPCPVDCIEMISANRQWSDEDADKAWNNYQKREARLQKQKTAELQRLATAAERALNKKPINTQQSGTVEAIDSKQQAIAAALAKARARRQSAAPATEKNNE
ncbi:MAG: RnfABCDGE type electron transport complex subunit B [Alcaligenaceae bacterium]|nr:RnfABCDGE type electron transport complex subunit B [Alcaligenaceae bacterium]